MSYTVYCHENKKNGKLYFGITKSSTRRRWGNGNGYKSQPLFYRAIKKYGWDGFEHIIMFTGLTEEEAKQAEIDLIREFHTQDKNCGYNITSGGDDTPHASGADSPVSKAVVVFNLDGTRDRDFETMAEAARYLNVNPSTLSAAINTREGTVSNHFCLLKDECGDCNTQPPRKRLDMRKRFKAVSQYDVDGQYIQTFESVLTASEKTGIKKSDISAVLTGSQHTAHGFQFRYSDGTTNNIGKAIMRGELTRGARHYAAKKVQLYNAHTGETIREYGSITEAARSESIPSARITSDCLHKWKTSQRDFLWRYADND